MKRMRKDSVFDWGIRGGLFLLIVLVPLCFSFQLTTYTLPKIVLAQTLVCSLLAFWFLKMILMGRISFARSMLFFPILIYFALSIFSLFSATSLPGGMSLLWQIFAYILIYFIVINHVQEKEIENWALIMTLVGVLVSLYGILQYFGIEPLLKGYYYIPYIPYSTLGHRNQVAQYFILLIPLSGGFFFLSSSWIKRAMFGIGTTMMIYVLFLTKSRGGILGFLLSLLFFLGIGIYRLLKRSPFFLRRKWFFLFFLMLLAPILFVTFPRTLTLKVKHINPIGYYVHSIDGSKIPANQTIRIEFDYRVIQGDPQKAGYLNLYGDRTNSAPIYLTQNKKEWRRIKQEDIYFPSTPYDEDIKLRWVPGAQDSILQLRNIIVQTQDGIDLIKDSFLNRLFSKLGVTEVDKVLSGQARLYMYRNTIEMIKHHFFLGAGFGNFKYVYPRFRDRGEWALSGLNTRVEQAHNEYLQIFSEVGLMGFLSFGLILVGAVRMIGFVIRRADSNRFIYIHLILTMGIIGTLIQSFFDFNLQNPASGITFWMFIGFLEVIYHSVRKGQSSSEDSPIHFSINPKGIRWIAGLGVLVCLILGIFFSVRPVVGDYYLKWGRFFQEQKDWGSASVNLEKASVFSPYNFDVFFHLGQATDQMKDYDRAVNFYKRCIGLHPYFIEARNNLGAIYIKLGMIDEAIEEFKGSIEINPYHPGLHNNLGYLYSKRNLLKNAVEEYHKTLELDPQNQEVYKNLGLLYFYKLKDYPKARQYWERYLALNPEDPQNEAIKNKIEEIKKGGH
jgi:Tfp pilus assembly protein PilF